MPSTPQDDERELADAILSGTHRRPAQSFGSYFGPEGGSCALGAAYEGIYLLPEHAEGTHPERLDRLFHCIDYVARRCPAGCKKHVPHRRPHRAPERRSPLDTGADRGLAPR